MNRDVVFKEHIFPFSQLKDENVRVFIEQPFCDYDIAEVHTPLDVETSDEHAEQTLVPTEHVSENITEEHGDDNMVDVPSPVPRVSSRMSHPLVWMKDYITHVTDLAHTHSLDNYVSYDHLSCFYQAYLSEILQKLSPKYTKNLFKIKDG